MLGYLTPGVKRIAVEVGVVGIDTFGESAPGGDVMKHFGFTVENVVKNVKDVL